MPSTLQNYSQVRSTLHIRAAGFAMENNAKAQANLLFKEKKLVYCIIGPDKEVQVVHSYEFSSEQLKQMPDILEQLILSDDILQRFVGKIHIAFSDLHHSLVPKDFFDAQELAAFYGVQASLDNSHLCYDFIPLIDYFNVFSIPRDIYNYLYKHYPQAQFHCDFSCLLSNVLTENLKKKGNQLLVNVGKNLMEVFIIKNQQITLQNCFEFQTSEDFLYHILNTAQVEHIDLTQTAVILLGEVYKTGSLYQLANQYLPLIQFSERPQKYRYNQALTQYPSHLYYNLFAI